MCESCEELRVKLEQAREALEAIMRYPGIMGYVGTQLNKKAEQALKQEEVGK